MKNINIGTRLNISFGVLVALIMLLAAVAYWRVGSVAHEIDRVANDRYPKIVLAQSIKNQLNETARSMRNMLLMSTPDEIGGELRSIEDDSREISACIAQLDKSIHSEEGRKFLAATVAMRQKFSILQHDFLALASAGKRDEATALLLRALRPAQLAYMTTLDQLINYQNELMQLSNQAAQDKTRQTEWIVLSLASLGIAIAVLVSRATTKSITQPLADAVRLAAMVASGDLTAKIEVRSSDETGRLMSALQAMNDSLLAVVGQVRVGAESIATGSSQMAAGNLDLSSRTEQQASALEETASSLEELTATVRQNSVHARHANGLASSASQVALQGGDVVAQVVHTMGAIKESSRKVADIIAVIDGIAFQTNILALNAAVEAARAGEQGRGFAVVATEVRSLAQRSAGAAKEIKSLIDDSVDKVELGSQLVERAGATMSDIVHSVNSVTAIMAEIAEASAQQESGLEQINQAVTEMDSVTQRNAALVEEAAGASASLQEQVYVLRDIVGRFNLGEGNAAPAHADGALIGFKRERLQLGR